MIGEQFIHIDEAYGDEARAEIELGNRILVDLGQEYPGYAWGCEVNHTAGTVTIALRVPALIRMGLGMPGYLLKLTTVTGPNGRERTLQAGGEILERWDFPRSNAPEFWIERARQKGAPDMDNAVTKSRF